MSNFLEERERVAAKAREKLSHEEFISLVSDEYLKRHSIYKTVAGQLHQENAVLLDVVDSLRREIQELQCKLDTCQRMYMDVPRENSHVQ